MKKILILVLACTIMPAIAKNQKPNPKKTEMKEDITKKKLTRKKKLLEQKIKKIENALNEEDNKLEKKIKKIEGLLKKENNQLDASEKAILKEILTIARKQQAAEKEKAQKKFDKKAWLIPTTYIVTKTALKIYSNAPEKIKKWKSANGDNSPVKASDCFKFVLSSNGAGIVLSVFDDVLTITKNTWGAFTNLF